jgi:DNA primase small subunit
MSAMPHSTSSLPEMMDTEDSATPNAPAQQSNAEDNNSQPTQDSSMPDATAKSTLEGMFDDDDDDDDEFSSSAATGPAQSSQPAPASQKAAFSDSNILSQFYQRLLPFRPLFQWLNHSATPQADFQHREFAFTLPGDRYVRYQSFASAELLRKACVQLIPERFEIGPQYSINPRDRKTVLKAGSFRPIMKELVFDIDMTDYDPIRTCCSGANICHKCWQFINMAIKVVDTALREDFGFQHILWVYSGRRGAHAWVSDKRAREMDDAKRRSIAGYLVVVTGTEHGKRMGIRHPLHPHLERSLKLLNPHFQSDVLEDQDPWQSTEQTQKLLDLLPDTKLVAALQKKWSSGPSRTSAQKWADIDSVAGAGNLSTLDTKQLVNVKKEIRIEYTYPRLDAEVSKKQNHLLKSPFVIHPGTGRVCVPIDVRRIEEFDPLAVPTVTQLLQQIDEWHAKNSDMSEENKALWPDWKKTDLRSYVEYFQGHVANLLKEENRGKRERDTDGGADSMEF